MMAETTGSRMRKRREELGLTHTAFAMGLGVKEANVYRWERGGSEPGLPMLRRIVKVLDVSADWLVFGKEWAEVEAEAVD